ncbi:MAG: peptidylprolyl isomerase [Phycisphaerae bacterium]
MKHAILVLTATMALLTCRDLLAGDGDAIALVNGEPISRQRLIDAVLEAHGLPVLQQIIVLDLAKQETRKRGLTVTAGDVERERQDALERIKPNDPNLQVHAEDRLRALDQVLEDRGVSATEFMISMERNAHLRKLVSADLKISDDDLREEFARTYGEKVLVRHIQLADRRGVDQAVDALSRGEDFAEVARRLSRNPDSAARGGELPAFTFDDSTYPALLREAAFSLKPGEVSAPLQVERMTHILKFEKRIPPENANFEDVRGAVEARVRDRATRLKMNELAQELFRKAQVRVLDPALREKYDAFLKKTGGRTTDRGGP